jgi:hypothetical protein
LIETWNDLPCLLQFEYILFSKVGDTNRFGQSLSYEIFHLLPCLRKRCGAGKLARQINADLCVNSLLVDYE